MATSQRHLTSALKIISADPKIHQNRLKVSVFWIQKQEFDHNRKRYLKLFECCTNPERKMIVYYKHVLGRRRKRQKMNALSAIKWGLAQRFALWPTLNCWYVVIATIGKRKNEIKKDMLTSQFCHNLKCLTFDTRNCDISKEVNVAGLSKCVTIHCSECYW